MAYIPYPKGIGVLRHFYKFKQLSIKKRSISITEARYQCFEWHDNDIGLPT